jgi:holin-like protein
VGEGEGLSIKKICVMILQLAIVFGFLAIGEIVVYFTGVPVPSSIIGMLLLAVALKIGVVKLRWVENAANFLLKNMGFFFVPAGVGLMNYFGLIGKQWLPIVGATVASTLIVLAFTGHAHQILRKISKK